MYRKCHSRFLINSQSCKMHTQDEINTDCFSIETRHRMVCLPVCKLSQHRAKPENSTEVSAACYYQCQAKLLFLFLQCHCVPYSQRLPLFCIFKVHRTTEDPHYNDSVCYQRFCCKIEFAVIKKLDLDLS